MLADDPINGSSESQDTIRVITRSQTKAGNEEPQVDLTDLLPGVEQNHIQKAQMQDDELSLLYNWLFQKSRPEWKDIGHLSLNIKRYWAKWDSLVLKNGLIYKQKFHSAPEVDTFQLLLPKPLRKEVMRLLHNNISAASWCHSNANEDKRKVLLAFST